MRPAKPILTNNWSQNGRVDDICQEDSAVTIRRMLRVAIVMLIGAVFLAAGCNPPYDNFIRRTGEPVQTTLPAAPSLR